MPGAVLGKRFRIVSLLGRGGMGEVYRADDLRLGQPVALKFLPPEVAANASRVERLHDEVRLARTVSHPNVCRVYDIEETDAGRPFLCMEYVDGEDLASLLRRIGRLPRPKTLQLARQLCAGVAAAHARGVLHRDLKPANVMLDGRGRVRVTDFGLAAVTTDAACEPVASLSGTPAYMAPEQLAGRGTSQRSDVYALGLLLYELVTGRRAFGAGVTLAAEDVDPALERVILRCLEPDPLHRPASAMAVLAALPGGGGGDALTEALAGGETPSPEMVAAAGGIGAIPAPVGIACLCVLLASLGLILLVAPAGSLLGRHPLALKPDVLENKAQEVLRRLGYDHPAIDSARGFHVFGEGVRWAAQQPPTVRAGQESDPLARLDLPVIAFWYRQSPRLMEPWLIQPLDVTETDPPMEQGPASVRVELDPQGRLWRLRVHPPADVAPATLPSPGSEVDWRPAFELAGLDYARFQPAAPLEVTLVSVYDRFWAWTAQGVLPGRPDLTLRVEAASLRGKAIRFSVIYPWQSAAATTAAAAGGIGVPPDPPPAAMRAFLALLVFSVVALAVRNARNGRGDRRGAFRLALWVLVTLSAVLVLTSGRPFWTFERLVVHGINAPLSVAAISWLLYVALEPYARRFWPQALVSWSRLLGGQWPDPLVGRDVLLGITAGAAGALTDLLAPAACRWFGISGGPAPVMPDLRAIAAGPPGWLAALLNAQGNGLVSGVMLLTVLLILRLVLRRGWAMLAAWCLLIGTSAAFSPETAGHPLLVALMCAQAVVGYVFAVRLGLLATAASAGAWTLLGALSPAGPGSWYGQGGLFAMACLVALALAALHTARAGRPWLSDSSQASSATAALAA